MGESNVNEIYCDHQCFLFIYAELHPQIFSHVPFLLSVLPQFFVFSEIWSLLFCGLCLSVLQACSGPCLWFKLPTVVLVLLFFFLLFFWNGCWNPLQKFGKRMSTSVSLFFFVFLWNGCRNPLQEFVKRMSTFVSFFSVFLWNRCRNPLQEFVKRMLTSVVPQNKKIIWNGCRHPLFNFQNRMSTSILASFIDIRGQYQWEATHTHLNMDSLHSSHITNKTLMRVINWKYQWLRWRITGASMVGGKLLELEMTNKPVFVGIARIHPRFDGKFPHWLGMGMGNPRFFQLGMGMRMNISPP